MKIDSFTLRLQYISTDHGDSKTFTVDLVNVFAANCDVSALGAKVGEKVQRVLDAHSDGAAALRAEIEELKATISKKETVVAQPVQQALPEQQPPKKRRGSPPKKRDN